MYTLPICTSSTQKESDATCTFSDVHGNWTALQEVWAALSQHGPFDAIICAGDLASGRLHPSECVDFLAEHDVVCVLGNTDTFFLDHPVPDSETRRRLAYLDAQIAWCIERLSSAAHRFLHQLTMTHEITFEPAASTLICHATPTDPWPICPPEAPDAVWKVCLECKKWSQIRAIRGNVKYATFSQFMLPAKQPHRLNRCAIL